MSEFGTNFPPQTYSSIFNLNVVAEREVIPTSSTENENSEPKSPQKHDCFTSSMATTIVILLTFLAAQTTAQICPQDSRIRTFSSLQEYQHNKVSFNKNDSDFMGNRIKFTSSMDKLESNAFVTYTETSITWLDLSDKNISEVQNNTFYSLKCLWFLDLSYNRISNLTREVFVDLASLQVLNLTQNNITNVTNMFALLHQLKRLDLSYNNITEMQQDCFDNNTKLEVLDLSHNGMKQLRGNFQHLINLKELYLDNNFLAIVYLDWFSKNRNLEVLDLSDNNQVMMRVVEDPFNPDKLKYLNLSNNCLMQMSSDAFVEEFSNAKTVIDINNNGFECQDLMQYLQVFQMNNITLAPGRNWSTEKQIHGILCDALLIPPGDVADNFLYLKVIVSCLGLIVLIFSILVAYDFLNDKKYIKSFLNWLGLWRGMRRESSVDYLLDAET